MSVTASFKAQAATQGCNWLFTDPYAYQYSDISGNAASSTQVKPGASIQDTTPVDTTENERVELEGSPVASYPVELDAVGSCISHTAASNNPRLKKSSSTIRNRFATVRESLKYPHRRLPVQSELPEVVEHTYTEENPAVHAYSSGLMPVAKPVSPPRYTGPHSSDASGLILADENLFTPITPASDFDAILRNIGPLPKKKRYCGPSRASRYYDRYSTNAG